MYFRALNIDELLEHYDFTYCFLFTKTNGHKIIIEDEYFLQKSITLQELKEVIEPRKVTLILDKPINNSEFDIRTVDNSLSNIKKTMTSLLHQKFNFKKGHYHLTSLTTDLPELIDAKNLINFIGRAIDVENLVKKIFTIKNENKILTLKGSGGIGKTTLVSKVVIEIANRHRFQNGIHFLQCEYIKDYDEFENKISFAFNMDNALNFKTQLKEQVSTDEERLIILDNIETVLHLDDTDKIKEFIKFISDYATIVITSRERLNEEFEDVYELRNLTTDEAEELFTNLYNIKNYDRKFLRNDILENMLNNNPLAIKLVTKNLPKNKDIKILKEELDSSFFDITGKEIKRMFEKESDFNIERTQSLFNSINYSYTRLTEKEKLALELLSLFPDGMHFENFKSFYNKKEKNDKDNRKTIKKKIENFSDRDLKSLEDKSLIINNNQYINLQSIIGRFADFKFNNRDDEHKMEYYNKAYIYNTFILGLTRKSETKHSISARIFDDNKNNFLKCLDYLKNLDLNNGKLRFIDDLSSNFAMDSSPNNKIFDKLNKLKNSLEDNEKRSFIEILILVIRYYYGDFHNTYEEMSKRYPMEDITNNYNNYTKVELLFIESIMNIYGMEGNQLEEVLLAASKGEINLSLFSIGEYSIMKSIFDNIDYTSDVFTRFELQLNTNSLKVKEIKKYINSLYKTQFIEKVQSIYVLLKVDKTEVSLKNIKKIVITNPFTDGLKTLMLAIKDDKNCSKNMYEDAIKKLYHIRYYHVEAMYLYCKYLKKEGDKDYTTWFEKSKKMALEHNYRYLLHQLNCLDSGIDTAYNEINYPLPKIIDYSLIIKKNKLNF